MMINFFVPKKGILLDVFQFKSESNFSHFFKFWVIPFNNWVSDRPGFNKYFECHIPLLSYLCKMIFKTISETIRNQKYTRYDLYGMFFFKFIGIFFENLIWLLNYVINILKIRI